VLGLQHSERIPPIHAGFSQSSRNDLRRSVVGGTEPRGTAWTLPKNFERGLANVFAGRKRHAPLPTRFAGWKWRNFGSGCRITPKSRTRCAVPRPQPNPKRTETSCRIRIRRDQTIGQKGRPLALAAPRHNHRPAQIGLESPSKLRPLSRRLELATRSPEQLGGRQGQYSHRRLTLSRRHRG
jgi:hypothetical protein